MFLFFKQKTAYEMRISDWSSDVCSSDLIAFNRPVDAATAQAVSAQFVEVLLAPEYSSEALAIFAAKKNVRVLQVPQGNAHNAFDIKRVGGGCLGQNPYDYQVPESEFQIATKLTPTAQQIPELMFAWKVAQYGNSNAHVSVANEMNQGVGGG